VHVLEDVARRERIEVGLDKLLSIAGAAKGNLRKALLMMETAHVQK
jgi:hypothetical protein